MTTYTREGMTAARDRAESLLVGSPLWESKHHFKRVQLVHKVYRKKLRWLVGYYWCKGNHISGIVRDRWLASGETISDALAMLECEVEAARKEAP